MMLEVFLQTVYEFLPHIYSLQMKLKVCVHQCNTAKWLINQQHKTQKVMLR